MTDRLAAIDIEAVPDAEPPEFDAPDSWTPFAVAVAHRPAADETVDTAVFVRRDGTDDAERSMLTAAASWIQDRQPIDCILDYNGGEPADPDGPDDEPEGFDRPILDHRIEQVAADDDHAGFLRRWLLGAPVGVLPEDRPIPHRDLFAQCKSRRGENEKWPTLSESLDDHDIPVASTSLGDRVVGGATMPALGESVLSSEGGLTDDERDALKSYARSDVEPLPALADRLDREADADAEARATLAGSGGDR